MVNIFLIKGSYKITQSNKKINYGPRTEIKKRIWNEDFDEKMKQISSSKRKKQKVQ